MVVAKKFVFIKEYDGTPKEENFQLAEEELPELEDGEFLVEAIYFSVDPYLRMWSINVGDTMIGSQVAKIIKSRSSKFPEGKYIVGGLGWRTHTIWKDNIPMTRFDTPHLVPFEADVPLSLALGILGMPGNTAYFGLLEICKPKSGETVVITAAAGAVGNHVGQIAKIKGCIVIGITSSDDKAKWLKSIGFDHVINYKTEDVSEALANVAPQGVDCYFDNVGGEISSTIIKQMNTGGRIAVCGSINSYGAAGKQPLAESIQLSVLTKTLKMEGFHVTQFMDRWNESMLQNLKWIQEGKLKYKESIKEGFEALPDALVGIFRGDNTGKAIVKV